MPQKTPDSLPLRAWALRYVNIVYLDLSLYMEQSKPAIEAWYSLLMNLKDLLQRCSVGVGSLDLRDGEGEIVHPPTPLSPTSCFFRISNWLIVIIMADPVSCWHLIMVVDHDRGGS